MNKKKFSEEITEVNDRYYEEAARYEHKRRNPIWLIWGVMAVCLCLVCIIVIPFIKTEQPIDTDFSQAPNIVINDTAYFQTAHQIAFEICPNGFEYGGVIESGTAEGCPYYINSQIPEWIYVKQETKRIGTTDDFFVGYVRYVDEHIRGKDLINFNGTIYVSVLNAEYPLIVDKALYDEVESACGRIVKDSEVAGFSPAGVTVFEGFDVIPYNDCGSNTHQEEERIYANPDNENVILLSKSWEAYSGTNDGFAVYIKTNYSYAKHENAEMLEYHGRHFSSSDLSAETIKWIQWYNSLSPVDQIAISHEPYELRISDESSYTIGAEKPVDMRTKQGKEFKNAKDTLC